MKRTISLTVNEEKWTVEVEPTDVLLDVLRSRIGVKSPKIGCERGDCGSSGWEERAELSRACD